MQNAMMQKRISTEYRPTLFAAVGCFIISAALCYAHISGSTALIFAVLVAYIVFTMVMTDRALGLTVQLYFLPWSPLLKLYSGSVSWFTIALLIYCILCFVKRGMKLYRYQIVLPAVIMILTLTAKLLHGNGIENSYLFFIVMLFVFPCAVELEAEKPSFWELTVFFALGIIAAALSAQLTESYGNISRFITVHSYQTITRLSGFYGDPNFYSAHITACLAGIQILLCFEKSARRRLVLAIIAVLLVYCGLLSASKSFIIVIACLFLIWIPILLEKSAHSAVGVQILFGVLCAAAVMLSSNAVRELLEMFSTRFSYHANISQLTTGRTELWMNYINQLLNDVSLTLMGQGYSNVLVGGRASHSSVIQSIFQFGIIGTPLLLSWLYCTLRLIGKGKHRVKWKYAALMCIGIVMPWFALDILFFDELFLLPVYGVIGALIYTDV